MTRPPFTETHVHFHDLRPQQLHYSWLLPGAPEDEDLGEYGAIRSERYWADDFLAEVRFQNVERVVHVQSAIGIEDPVEETRWLQAFADRLGAPHGVVASGDLAAPDVGEHGPRDAGHRRGRRPRPRRGDRRGGRLAAGGPEVVAVELARRANEQGVELAELPITPAAGRPDPGARRRGGGQRQARPPGVRRRPRR